MKTKFKIGNVVIWEGKSGSLTESGLYSLGTEYIIQGSVDCDRVIDDEGYILYINEEDFTLVRGII
jgi:hypothetical protein